MLFVPVVEGFLASVSPASIVILHPVIENWVRNFQPGLLPLPAQQLLAVEPIPAGIAEPKTGFRQLHQHRRTRTQMWWW
jgi:hypothetical protein